MRNTGTKVLNGLVDNLNEMGMSEMALSLDTLYHSSDFTKLDNLTVVSMLVESQYTQWSNRRFENRLKRARLNGCPQQLSNCQDSSDRSYEPTGITDVLSNLNFISDHLNVCILGAAASGKSYLAKAIGIQACQQFSVEYHTCEDLLSDLAELKKSNYEKYTRKIKHLTRLDLLILDDFLLHTIDDEGELKVLHSILDKRVDCKSTIVCSQRSPQGWASMMLNDEVSSNAITKRVTKHYTVLINPKI